ncbi:MULTISPECIES: hypothetical protein [unclassified Vibrio]|uniref:hypothetical protein n=1 Tax=unclassified Vibrio TaxID=2614977 RepID=UPI0027CE26E0|nr:MULTISPECIES: hypothetical protein [unclassified Vibrio]EKO3657008.1 hypothetical protein [Vibrio metschnikovii]EKO3695233.1 hypothetical protein [Vibrio metschnikovii]EKO3922542.1 hypothetical protein [Vibrio metschnikovii]MDQ2110151.1 hypothetical protein [Vibrio sp. 2017_1457_15]MDQ2162966.1 hypothetical protein [Vibrio sp. 2017_1457_13]
MAIDHFARAKKAWPILINRAQTTCEPFTYKEISNLIGLHHRAARWFLSEIQEFCNENELAPLQALVVNKRTRLPGEGYYGSAITPEAHRKALKKVRKEKWAKVKFNRR